jgi:hypothetical protein
MDELQTHGARRFNPAVTAAQLLPRAAGRDLDLGRIESLTTWQYLTPGDTLCLRECRVRLVPSHGVVSRPRFVAGN